MRRKTVFTAVLALILCLGLGISAAADNRVTELFVDVTLRPDGSAYVVQTWDGTFDEGSECYFPITNLGEVTLSNLQVSDADGPYTPQDNWDTDASFEEKARASGLNPVSGGYEVCWGISNYGDNRYAVEYILDGLVGAYDDADGFLFQFVPRDMNTGPTDVTVRIQTQDGTPLTEDNAGIWAFGFEGQIGFSEGGVVAYSQQPITGGDSVIVMLRLQKGVVTPSRAESGSFEEVKNRAFEGSDYGGDEGPGWKFWGTILLCAVGAVAVLLWFCGKEGRRVDKVYKSADYWREAPIGGNLEASFVLANRFYQANDEGNLVAATLTRLLAEGCLVPDVESDISLMNREKKSVNLRLVKPPARGMTVTSLYAVLVQAAGRDGVLQERELESYCKTNYTALLNVVQEAKRDGGETLAGIGCYKSPTDINTLAGLTERGHTLLLQLVGYKKYLLDFSLIAERGANEAVIWQDCLAYAALLGIGEQVLKELKSTPPA